MAALQVSPAALTVASGIVHGDALIIGPVVFATGLVLLAGLRWSAPAMIAVGALFLVGLLSTVLAAFSAGRSLSAALAIVVPRPALCGLVLRRRRPAVRLLAERNASLERVRSLTAAQVRLEGRVRIAGRCTTCWATGTAPCPSTPGPSRCAPRTTHRGSASRRSCRVLPRSPPSRSCGPPWRSAAALSTKPGRASRLSAFEGSSISRVVAVEDGRQLFTREAVFCTDPGSGQILGRSHAP